MLTTGQRKDVKGADKPMNDSVDKSWVCIHMRPNSDAVQVTSNLADKRVAELYAESLEEIGGRVIAICSTVALWADKTDDGFGFDMMFKITAVAVLVVGGIGGTALSVLAYLALR